MGGGNFDLKKCQFWFFLPYKSANFVNFFPNMQILTIFFPKVRILKKNYQKHKNIDNWKWQIGGNFFTHHGKKNSPMMPNGAKEHYAHTFLDDNFSKKNWSEALKSLIESTFIETCNPSTTFSTAGRGKHE